MIVLGLNIFHANASAVILVNGKVEFAIEEERINRIKNSGGFPKNSIIECLKYLKINLSDIDYIVINTNHSALIFNKILFGLRNIINFSSLKSKLLQYKNRLNLKKEIENIKNFGIFNGKFEMVEHHISHISSAFFLSKFDEACGVSIDGSGDFTTTSNANCSDHKIYMNHRILYPHSLGIFYSALTNYLGFNKYGEEYKVMAMGAYGDNSLTSKIQKLINYDNQGLFSLNLDYFVHHKSINTFTIFNNEITNNILLNENRLFEELGLKKRKNTDPLTKNHFNLAKSLQVIYENSFFNYLNYSQKIIHSKNLCLAGGCAMNSLANGKIKDRTKFKKIFIQPASYDAGGALGAAKYIYYKYSNIKKRFKYNNFYFGNSFTNQQVYLEIKNNEKIFKQKKIKIYKYVGMKKKLIIKLSDLLLKKKIIGVFRGRLEWGARALGNRSIIADPRGDGVKELLNSKIKRRESFRPFAPMILKKFTNEWFGVTLEVPNMMEVYKIKIEKKNLIPAVVHEDGTCRLQTVSKNNNKFMYSLLQNFFKLTRVPIILNTSFNENEPIVCKPSEAIKTFLRTDMDALVLEDYLICR